MISCFDVNTIRLIGTRDTAGSLDEAGYIGNVSVRLSVNQPASFVSVNAGRWATRTPTFPPFFPIILPKINHRPGPVHLFIRNTEPLRGISGIAAGCTLELSIAHWNVGNADSCRSRRRFRGGYCAGQQCIRLGDRNVGSSNRARCRVVRFVRDNIVNVGSGAARGRTQLGDAVSFPLSQTDLGPTRSRGPPRGSKDYYSPGEFLGANWPRSNLLAKLCFRYRLYEPN